MMIVDLGKGQAHPQVVESGPTAKSRRWGWGSQGRHEKGFPLFVRGVWGISPLFFFFFFFHFNDACICGFLMPLGEGAE